MSKPSGVLVMFPREGFDYPMDAALEHEFRGLKHAGVGLLIYPGVLHGKAVYPGWPTQQYRIV